MNIFTKYLLRKPPTISYIFVSFFLQAKNMNSTHVSYNFPLRYIFLFSFFLTITLVNLIDDQQYDLTEIQKQNATTQDNENSFGSNDVIFNSVNICTPEFAHHITFDDKFNAKKNPTIIHYIKTSSQPASSHFLFSTFSEAQQAHSPILRI